MTDDTEAFARESMARSRVILLSQKKHLVMRQLDEALAEWNALLSEIAPFLKTPTAP